MLYSIVRCPHCKNFVSVKHGSRTTRCPYCGARLKLYREDGAPILKVYAVVEGREVPQVVKRLKELEK